MQEHSLEHGCTRGGASTTKPCNLFRRANPSYLGSVERYRDHATIHPGDGFANGAIALSGVAVIGGVAAELLAVGILLGVHVMPGEQGYDGSVDKDSDVLDLGHGG